MTEIPMYLDEAKRELNPAYPWPLVSTDARSTVDGFCFLIWQIEKCGASEDLTKAVVMAGDLRDALRKQLLGAGEATAQRCAKCEAMHAARSEDFASRVPVEQRLLDAFTGKKPLPTKEECRDLAHNLGIPDEYREPAHGERGATHLQGCPAVSSVGAIDRACICWAGRLSGVGERR